MKISFWGVRGSVPTPVSPEQIQAKITAVIQRITSEDIKSPDSREKFIASLPDWIFGTTGGNTSCVVLESDEGECFVLDAGTGIRSFGKKASREKIKHFNLFFSHLHWDHIQGLPFFDPAYDKTTSFDVYACHDGAEETLRSQQSEPNFPASGSFDSFTKEFVFHKAEPGVSFQIGNVTVNACKMSHPGDSYAYSFEENGKKVVYATDSELSQKDFESDEIHEAVFRNADCVIMDTQYTVEESHEKANWGHSAFSYAVDFAVKWGIKELFMFHHEPSYDDKKLNSLLEAARWYAKYIVHSDIKISLAVENQDVLY